MGRTNGFWALLGRTLRRGAALAALAAAAWSLSPAPAAGQAWWNSAWTKRQELKFNNKLSSTALVNFPVLVVLNSNRIDFAFTQNSGQDLRFVDADGSTVLSHEIEKWDESGNCYVWVKVPQIDAASDTDSIWMYYGNSGAADGQNASGVWDANFKMVQHFEETSGSISDSTGSANHGTNNGAASTTAGRVGNARTFNGSSQYISVPHASSLNMTSAVSISAWIKADAGGLSGYDTVVFKGTAADTANYYLDTYGTNAAFGYYNGGWQEQMTGWLGLKSSTWYFLAATYSDSSNRTQIYVDGKLLLDVADYSSLVTNSQSLTIGRYQAAGEYFSGTLDEVRVSNTARSADWMRAEFQTSADLFILWPESLTQTVTLPTLWGVDQTDGTLFSITDYTRPTTTLAIYGALKYDNAGTPTNIGYGVKGMSIDSSGMLYFAVDKSIAGYSRPVLFRFDLSTASTTADNVAVPVGYLGPGYTIRGLAFDPTNGTLYAVKSSTLYTVDKSTGATLTSVGTVSGSGNSLGNGQDLAFDAAGTLYVADSSDDHLYEVNKSTAAITALVDQDTEIGSGRIQAIAVDHVTGRMLGTDVTDDSLKQITFENGVNPYYGFLGSLGLDDVQAISFDPRSGGIGTPGVRILKWVELP